MAFASGSVMAAAIAVFTAPDHIDAADLERLTVRAFGVAIFAGEPIAGGAAVDAGREARRHG